MIISVNALKNCVDLYLSKGKKKCKAIPVTGREGP
jgi:hypothetical protein